MVKIVILMTLFFTFSCKPKSSTTKSNLQNNDGATESFNEEDLEADLADCLIDGSCKLNDFFFDIPCKRLINNTETKNWEAYEVRKGVIQKPTYVYDKDWRSLKADGQFYAFKIRLPALSKQIDFPYIKSEIIDRKMTTNPDELIKSSDEKIKRAGQISRSLNFDLADLDFQNEENNYFWVFYKVYNQEMFSRIYQKQVIGNMCHPVNVRWKNYSGLGELVPQRGAEQYLAKEEAAYAQQQYSILKNAVTNVVLAVGTGGGAVYLPIALAATAVDAALKADSCQAKEISCWDAALSVAADATFAGAAVGKQFVKIAIVTNASVGAVRAAQSGYAFYKGDSYKFSKLVDSGRVNARGASIMENEFSVVNARLPKVE